MDPQQLLEPGHHRGCTFAPPISAPLAPHSVAVRATPSRQAWFATACRWECTCAAPLTLFLGGAPGRIGPPAAHARAALHSRRPRYRARADGDRVGRARRERRASLTPTTAAADIPKQTGSTSISRAGRARLPTSISRPIPRVSTLSATTRPSVGGPKKPSSSSARCAVRRNRASTSPTCCAPARAHTRRYIGPRRPSRASVPVT